MNMQISGTGENQDRSVRTFSGWFVGYFDRLAVAGLLVGASDGSLVGWTVGFLVGGVDVGPDGLLVGLTVGI